MEIFKTISIYVVVGFLTLGASPLFPSCFAQSDIENRDSLKAEQLYAKALEVKKENLLDSTIFYAHQAAQIFAEAQLWEKWYDCKWEVYYSLFLQSKLEEALNQIHQDSVSIIPKTNSPYFSAKINDWMGFIYYRQELYAKALKYYLSGVELLEQANHPNEEYGNLTNIGIIYTMQGDYDLAITYLKRSEAVNLKNSSNLKRVYANLGSAYNANREYDKAIETYKKWAKVGGTKEEFEFFPGRNFLECRPFRAGYCLY